MTLSDISIIIKSETLHRYESGSVVGCIFLKTNFVAFPSDDWNDFPVVITGWWMREVMQLLQGETTQASCLFMDGSFQYDIYPQSNGLWRIEFADNSEIENLSVLSRIEVEPRGFIDALLAAANTISKTCQTEGWNSKDLDRLRQLYSHLNEQLHLPSPVAA